MKLLKINVQGLRLYPQGLDIDFVTQQRIMSNHSEMLHEISPQLHLNTALAFIGVNASGKTTTLKVVSFVMQMLNNDAINRIEHIGILQHICDAHPVVFESYFTHGKDYVFKLRTVIGRDDRTNEIEKRYVITDETLWRKELKKVKTRKTLFDFFEEDIYKRREGNETYLPADVSIIISVNKEYNTWIYRRDLINWTDINLIRILGDFPKEIVTFLDPSIEYLTFDLNEQKKTSFICRLKFYGQTEVILYNPKEIQYYLSSGTVKGINVYMQALMVLENGGYLIIDELENHFNKVIATTLLRIFMNKEVNKKGAVILFSTHYPEILDQFDRNDNIYIIRNMHGIQVNNLSSLLKRNDLKRSEVYESDILGGTAPQYDAYISLKRAFLQEIRDGEQNDE